MKRDIKPSNYLHYLGQYKRAFLRFAEEILIEKKGFFLHEWTELTKERMKNYEGYEFYSGHGIPEDPRCSITSRRIKRYFDRGEMYWISATFKFKRCKEKNNTPYLWANLVDKRETKNDL